MLSWERNEEEEQAWGAIRSAARDLLSLRDLLDTQGMTSRWLSCVWSCEEGRGRGQTRSITDVAVVFKAAGLDGTVDGEK